MTLHKNIRQSFHNVKHDVRLLQQNIVDLNERLAQQSADIATLRNLLQEPYVASKKGKVAYKESSLHARNIKPDNRIIFSDRNKAVAAGYRIKS
jgi:hypothetical protein